MNTKKRLPLFLKSLFWSYKFSSINPKRDEKRIVINAINFGMWEHWLWIFRFYGKNRVKKIIMNTPQTEFRDRALKLASLLLGIKKMNYASRNDYIKRQKNI